MVFLIDRNLQIMAITDDLNDWRAPLVRYLQGERMGSLKELTKMEWKA